MKNSLSICLIHLTLFFPYFSFADVYVEGYYKKDGTYVAPHYRSSPNSTKADNWSTYGNINPYTGEIGTKKYNDYNNYGNSTNSLNYYESATPIQNPSGDLVKYDIENLTCTTNNVENTKISMNKNKILINGKYSAYSVQTDFYPWLQYKNKKYSYYFGDPNNNRIPIRIKSEYGLDTYGFCSY